MVKTWNCWRRAKKRSMANTMIMKSMSTKKKAMSMSRARVRAQLAKIAISTGVWSKYVKF